jgi:hypothetical protein
MSGGMASYAGDGSTLLLGSGALVIVCTDADGELVEAMWPAVSGGSLPDLLTVLAARIGRLPDFGLVHHGSGLLTVLVRGAVSIEVHRSGGLVESVSAGPVATWRECGFTEVERVLVVAGPVTSARRLPLLGGIVRASAVEWEPADAESPPQLAKPQAVTPIEPVAAQPEPVAAQPEPTAAQPEPSTLTWSEPGQAEEVAAPRRAGLMDRLSWVDDLTAQPSPGPQLAPSPGSQPAPQAAREATAGLVIRQGDHFGDTVARPVPAVVRNTLSMKVHAIRCPSLHLNPPATAVCRICRLPLDELQLPEEVDQPLMGRLRRASTGESWPLVRPLTVIGREPRASGVDAQLISTSGSTANISRVHLEIRLQGWQVEVVDRSTHGSRMINPNDQPIELEKDKPVRILPGAELVLANEVTLRYEVS